jgi:hypothetical protein
MVNKPNDFKPFPVQSLPEVLRRFVLAAATTMGADPAYIATPLLGVLAGAIGNSRAAIVKRGWVEPAVVWVLNVGPSGSVKSSCIDHPSKAIKAAQRRKMKEWQAECNALEATEARPPLPRFWCDDVTLEALASVLHDNPRGTVVIVDEAAGWAMSFGQYKAGRGGDEQKWLTMHGARDLQIDRKTGAIRYLYIPRAAVSVVGGIQPSTLRQVLTPERFASGFAARLLLAMPPIKQKVFSEAELPEDVENELAELFDRLLALSMTTDSEGDLRPIWLPLNRGAKELFIAYFNELNANLPDDERIRAAAAKLEGAAVRLALILHCVRMVAGDPSLASNEAIDATSMSAGIELAKWYRNEAERVYTVLSEGEFGKMQNDLIEWITAQGGKTTARDLQRAKPNRFTQAAVAESALQELVALEIGNWENKQSGPNGGKPTRVFVLRSGTPIDNTPLNTENAEVSSIVNEATEGDDGPDWDDINAELRADGMASRGVF